MTNSRAAKGLELLDNHLATGTEASYTFTKTLDMKTKYRAIDIYMTGKTTAALFLQLLLTAHTAYNHEEDRKDSSVYLHTLAAAATEHTLIHNSLLDGAVTFATHIIITFNDATDTMMILAHSSAPHEGASTTSSEDTTAGTTITSIKLQVNTSTWIAGTEISIYGLLR